MNFENRRVDFGWMILRVSNTSEGAVGLIWVL